MFVGIDERDGMATSLEHTKQLLSETKQRDTEMTSRVTSLETQLQTLSAANQEVREQTHQLGVLLMPGPISLTFSSIYKPKFAL